MSGKIRGIDATESEKGVSQFANSAETIAGQIDNKFVSPKNLNAAIVNAIGGLKFTGLKYEKFVKDIVMQPNYMYICTDPGVNPPAAAQLPARGVGKAGDIIIVYNITTYEGVSFKVTLNTDLILHHDGEVITEISNKYLLGDKGGSCVLLGCGGNQQWFSLFHYQITLTSGS